MAVNTIEFAPPPANVAAIPHDYVARLSVEQYHEMIEAGILQSGDPIELLEGWLVYKMPKNPPHVYVTSTTAEIVQALLPVGWFVRQQDPITFEDSEPEPDVSVVRGHVRLYVARHPIPSEVALVIEVSDSTLERDQHVKQRIYAEGRIPFYWIINLVHDQIEVYSNPSGSGAQATYLRKEIFRATDSIALVIENKQVGSLLVQDLLP